jgi:hypothetical protein
MTFVLQEQHLATPLKSVLPLECWALHVHTGLELLNLVWGMQSLLLVAWA